MALHVSSARSNLGLGNFTATNNITAYSDIRLKKDLNIIESPINKINNINGYTFKWKETGKSSIGVIAQEVYEIFPELVLIDDNGYYSVDCECVD